MRGVGALLAFIGFLYGYMLIKDSEGRYSGWGVVLLVFGVIGVFVFFGGVQAARDTAALLEVSERWSHVDAPVAAILAARLGDEDPPASEFVRIDSGWPIDVLRALVSQCQQSVAVLQEWLSLVTRVGTAEGAHGVERVCGNRQILLDTSAAALSLAKHRQAEQQRIEAENAAAEQAEQARKTAEDEAEIGRLMEELRRERGNS